METRAFQMHHNLLRDVIERQAGTLDKAVLEGVMNAIEARSPKAEITLTPTTLTIKDYGKGFEDREEVLAAFEVFGKSDERKKEEKRWARFQMGRGQLFAFGRTTYRTRTFRMTVDIRDEELGLGYALEENLPDEPGCEVTVQLYETIPGYQIGNVRGAIVQNVKYVDIPLFFNGEQVNSDPTSEKWTLTTDEAFIRLNASSNYIAVYNLGVFVRQERAPGVGGVLVSRKQLDLNFARNDVIRTCPVFKAAMAHFRERGEKELLDKSSFRPEEVGEVLERLECGEYSAWQVMGLKLFKNTNNKRVSLHDLAGKQVALGALGSQLADKAMQTKTYCVVLDQEHLAASLATNDPAGALKKLFQRVCAKERPMTLVDTSVLYKGINVSEVIFKSRDLRPHEKVALVSLNRFFGQFGYFITGEVKHRTILLGKMDGARAWTNGTSYICFHRTFLSECLRNSSGWVHLIDTLAHEYAHQGDERTHDGDFYERYHDIMDVMLQGFSQSFKDFTVRLLDAAKKLPTQHLTLVKVIESYEGAYVHEAPEEAAPYDDAIAAAVAKPAPKKRGPAPTKAHGEGMCRCGKPAKVKNGRTLKNCDDCITKAVARWSANQKAKATK